MRRDRVGTNWLEDDAFSRWRRWSFWHKGERKRRKADFNRRARRTWRARMARGEDVG